MNNVSLESLRRNSKIVPRFLQLLFQLLELWLLLLSLFICHLILMCNTHQNLPALSKRAWCAIISPTPNWRRRAIKYCATCPPLEAAGHAPLVGNNMAGTTESPTGVLQGTVSSWVPLRTAWTATLIWESTLKTLEVQNPGFFNSVQSFCRCCTFFQHHSLVS